MTNLCPGDVPDFIRKALCIIGDKWTVLIVNYLHDGPQRYKEISTALPGMSPRTLSQRLEMLQTESIVTKQSTGDGAFHSYALTKKGEDLQSVITAMEQWALHHYGSCTVVPED